MELVYVLVLEAKFCGFESHHPHHSLIDNVVYVSKHEVDLSKGSFAFRLAEGKKNTTGTKRKIYTDFGNLEHWPTG